MSQVRISSDFQRRVCQGMQRIPVYNQLVGAFLPPAWGARGRRFESFHTDQKR